MYLDKFKWNGLLKHLNCYFKRTSFRNNSSCGCNCDSYAKDRVALITGGADGIGLECAKELLRNGARGVVIGDIQKEKECVDTLSKEFGCGKIVFQKCDVTNKKELADLFQVAIDRWNCLHIVVNNAGILNDKEWEKEIAINVVATVRGTYLGFKYLGKDQGGCGGAIVNIGSVCGLKILEAVPVYVGTKHFLIGFSRSIGDQYHYDRTCVKVLTVCPGVTQTSMVTDATEFTNTDFDPNIANMLTRDLTTSPKQKPNMVAKSVIEVLNKGDSGGVFVCEASVLYEVRIPDGRNFRVCPSSC